MRVLWLVRRNLAQHAGGDTTQILHTKAALERLGVSIELISGEPRQLRDFDAVHLFHLDRLWEHLPVCRTIRAPRVPAVLSTIYWPADEFDRRGRRGFQGALARTLGSDRYQTLRLLQRCGLQSVQGRTLPAWHRRLLSFRSAARHLLDTASVILPNSVAEREAVERKFGVTRPAVIVPNAADIETFAPRDGAPGERRAGVLCVGRIEPRKNQLMLIRALRDAHIPLTLVGHAGRFNRRYARQCRDAAGEDVRFIDRRNATGLRALYCTARVHACASWYETPGLASLEAGLCGCNLVVTPGGSTREYFGEHADYCEPQDAASIRAAIATALDRAPSDELARLIRGEFNWDAAARATLRGYELAIASTPTARGG